MPLSAGLALVNGYTGEHPVRRVEAAAVAPYPVAGDIQLAGVWISDAPSQVMALEQSYDFSTGELTTRFQFPVGSNVAKVEVLTFCSRASPALCARRCGSNAYGSRDCATIDSRRP